MIKNMTEIKALGILLLHIIYHDSRILMMIVVVSQIIICLFIERQVSQVINQGIANDIALNDIKYNNRSVNANVL